jgi:hypothetical protein
MWNAHRSIRQLSSAPIRLRRTRPPCSQATAHQAGVRGARRERTHQQERLQRNAKWHVGIHDGEDRASALTNSRMATSKKSTVVVLSAERRDGQHKYFDIATAFAAQYHRCRREGCSLTLGIRCRQASTGMALNSIRRCRATCFTEFTAHGRILWGITSLGCLANASSRPRLHATRSSVLI